MSYNYSSGTVGGSLSECPIVQARLAKVQEGLQIERKVS